MADQSKAHLTDFGGNIVDEAEQSIKEGLDVTSARSDALFGDLLRDPALTALYADEVKGVLDQIKVRVAHYANHLRESDS